MTTAAYQITEESVPVLDANNSGFYVDGGKLRSQGVELDVLGQITPELQAVGNYAYTATKVLDSNILPVGAPFLNIPLHSGSLWLKYTFQTGPLKNFGGGMGFFASGAKSGDNNNDFNLPGYARLDAGVWYSFRLHSGQEVKLQVDVFNLLDKTYYESSASTSQVEPGTPLSVMGKCSVTF